MIDLDLLGGLFTAGIAVALIFIHSMTSAKHGRWINIPNYVRFGIFLLIAAAVIRSVNFFTLSQTTLIQRGHVNLEGVFLFAVCLYVAITGAYWVAQIKSRKTTVFVRAEMLQISDAPDSFYRLEEALPSEPPIGEEIHATRVVALHR